MTDIGTGTTFTTKTVDSTASRIVLAFPQGNGLQVEPLAGLTGSTAYSVVLLYQPTTLTGFPRLGAGSVARIRIYKTALTGAQASALDRLPTSTADVALELTDAPNPVLHGNLLAATATATDNGPASTAAATATLAMPSGVTFVGASPVSAPAGPPPQAR